MNQRRSDDRSRHARYALRPIAVGVMLACGHGVLANPSGHEVKHGSASFSTAGKNLTVTNAPGTVINWQSFSIGAGERTHFSQQSASSAVLNRVVGSDRSDILGALSSNGRVFLVNPHGIVFGAGARIDTAGFIASTLNMADRDFLEGRLKFEGGGHGVLRNERQSEIRASGDILLVGPAIENAGLIRSENGSVLLAAGRSVTITSPDAQGVKFALQAPTDSAVNVGAIEAANAAAMFAGTLTHSGDIRAITASLEGGRVVLSAQKEAIVQSGGVVNAAGEQGGSIVVQSGDLAWVEGRLDASGASGKGGSVHVLGERVGLSGARIDASGGSGGGTILVGGDVMGRNPEVPNARATYVSAGTVLSADATAAGDGGKVVVWANDTTRTYGEISARGGPLAGDGGFVETSGHYLEAPRPPDVRAPAGKGGTWLVDPGEVIVTQAAAELNLDPTPPPFAPVDENAPTRLLASTVNSFLTTNANLIVTTAGGIPNPGGSGDIIFDADPTLGGAISIEKQAGVFPASTLTLLAAGNIRFRRGTTTFSAIGGGGPALTIDMRPGFTGSVIIEAGGTVTLMRDTLGNQVTAQVSGGRNWQNDGTINVTPGTSIRLFDEALFGTLDNRGTLNLDTTGSFAISSQAGNPLGVLSNSGTVNVASNAIVEAAFSNAAGGTVNVNGGTLFLLNPTTIEGTLNLLPGTTFYVSETRGAGATFTGTTVIGSGIVNVQGSPGGPNPPVATFRNVTAADATLNVDENGTAIFDTAGSTFRNVAVPFVPPVPGLSQSGVLTTATGLTVVDQLMLGSSATFNGATTAGTVTLSGGTLDGAGDLTASALNWSGGTIAGTGVKTFTSVTSSNNVNFSGNMALDGGTWTNAASLAQDGAGRLTLANGAVVNNNASWNLASSDPDPIVHGGGAATTFENAAAGVFVDSGPVAHALTVNSFRNSGTVNLVPGANLTLPARQGLGLDTGSVSVGAGATLVLNGNRTFGNAASITGSGNLEIAGGIVSAGPVLTTGTLTVSGGTGVFDNGVLNPSAVTVNGGVASFDVPVNTGGVTVSAGSAIFNSGFTDTLGLTISGGTLNFNGALKNVTGPVLQSGGTFGGAASVNLNGLFTWTAGTLAGASATTRAIGGLLFSGDGLRTTTRGLLEVPAGATATWTDGGTLTIGSGRLVRNLGTWEDQSSGATVSTTGLVNFENPGLYRKSGPGTTLFTGARFDNQAGGSVDVQAGTLSLGGGGTHDAPFDVSSGATLRFAGGVHALQPAAALNGPGDFALSGGFLDVRGGSLPRLILTGGSLERSTAGDLTISGPFMVSGGRIGAGTGTVITSGATTVSGTLEMLRNWTNTGTLDLTGGRITSIAGFAPTLANQGTFNITTDVGNPLGSTAPVAFANTGTVNKSSPGLQEIFGSVANNAGGTLNVNLGELRLSGAVTQAGAIEIAQDAILSTGGKALTNAEGGVIGGGGTVNLGGERLTNNGRLRPGTPAGSLATLKLTGNLVQGATGSIDIDVGAAAPAGADRLEISGGAALAGTLNVAHIDSFLPSSDTSYTLLTFASRTGDFATKNVPAGYAPFYTLAPGAASYVASLGSIVNAWSGLGSGLWENPANWSLGHLPTDGEDVNIDVVGLVPKQTITVSAGAQRARRVTSMEDLSVTGGVLTLGPLDSTIDGSFAVSGTGTAILNGGLAASSIELSGGGTLSVGGAGSLARLKMTGGVLTRAAAGDLTITGPFSASGGVVSLSAPGDRFITSGVTTIVDDGADPFTAANDWLNTGQLHLNGPLALSGANFTNAAGATLNVNTGGVMDLAAARLTNDGTLNLRTGDELPFGAVAGANAILNNGAINKLLPTVPLGADFVNLVHPVTNTATGRINVLAGTLAVDFGGAQSGAIEIAAGAQLDSGSFTNALGGVIGGRGTLQLAGGMVTNEGSVRPGLSGSGGTLTIDGSFANPGTLAVRLGGQAAGEFGQLNVTGTATLGGTLALTAAPGYTAPDGDTFRIVTAGTVAGDFATTTKTFANGVNVLERPSFYLIGLGAPTVNSWFADVGGLWNDPAFWSLGHVPLANEQVYINRPTSLAVTLPAGAFSVDSLRSRENMILNGMLALASASSVEGTLTIASGGVLQGAGALSVSDLTVTSGTIASTGGVKVSGMTTVSPGALAVSGLLATNGLDATDAALEVQPGGTLELTGAGRKALSGATTFDNRGTLILAGTSDLFLVRGASPSLNNSGTIDLRTNVGIGQSGVGPNPSLTNTGTIRKSGGGGVSRIGGNRFGLTSNGGTFEATAGNTLAFGGSLGSSSTTFNGTAFVGAGVNRMDGDTTFDGTITSTNLLLDAGLARGTATFSGTTAWGEALLAGNFTVPAASTVNLTGAGVHSIAAGGVLTNNGTVNVIGAGTAGTGSMVNAGTLNVPGGGTTELAARFSNLGTVNVDGGTLRLTGSGTDSGVYAIDPGTTLDIAGGTRVFDPGAAAGGTGAFRLSGGTLDARSGTLAKLEQTGGTLTRTTDGDVTIAGAYDVSGGTVGAAAGDGRLITGGATSVTGNVTMARRWTNRGVATIAAGAIDLAGAALELANEGTFNVSTAAPFVAGDDTIVNRGTFNKNGAGVSNLGNAFTNAAGGTLNVNAGTLRLPQAANQGGTIVVAAASALEVTGNLTLGGGTLGGAGTIAVSGSTGVTGASTLNGTLTTGAVSVAGATFNESAGAVLNLTGDATLADGGIWDNAGTINLNGASRIVLGGAGAATLVNRGSGAIVDATSSATPVTTAGATRTGKSFVNAGRFTKTAAAAATQTLDAPMTNTGTIDVDSGRLAANGLASNSGIIDVAAGATFSTGGAALVNNAFGVLTGKGTFEAATVTNNAGTVAPGESPGTLAIAGDFVQGPGGTLLVELGGATPGTHFDVLNVTGAATLGGTLVVTRSGVPTVEGSAFEFLRYASRTGDFTAFSVPPGFAFQTSPGPASYTLVNSAAPTITRQTLVAINAVTQKETTRTAERVLVTQTPQNLDPEDERRALQQCR